MGTISGNTIGVVKGDTRVSDCASNGYIVLQYWVPTASPTFVVGPVYEGSLCPVLS